jgi:predicted CopG family antitoxin
MSAKLKTIAVDEMNYQALQNLGKTGMSFNDVLTEVLREVGARK